MAKKGTTGKSTATSISPAVPVRSSGRPSALLDTRVVYCGDNLEQLAKLPDACVDLIYIYPPFNSNRNYEVFCGEIKESDPSKTATPLRRRTSTTYVPAVCSSPASSRKPADASTVVD
jgi:hypothetical protein